MRLNTLILLVILTMATTGCSASRTADLEANKELVRRFTEAVNAADWHALGGLVADDFSRHSQASAGKQVNSREEFIQLQQSFLASVPDQRVTLHKLIAEGDEVAVLATYAGTHTGPMGDFPITGKPFQSTFLAIFRIDEGQVAELWVEADNMAMLTQLGLFPPPPQSSAE